MGQPPAAGHCHASWPGIFEDTWVAEQSITCKTGIESGKRAIEVGKRKKWPIVPRHTSMDAAGAKPDGPRASRTGARSAGYAGAGVGTPQTPPGKRSGRRT